jgi:hypothetical protein
MAKVEVRDGKIVAVTPLSPEEIAKLREQETAELEGPKPPPGLQIEQCAPTQPAFEKGQPPLIRLALKNRGREPISVPLGPEEQGRLQPGGPLEIVLVTREDGRVSGRNPRKGEATRWIDLAPEQQANFIIRLDEWHGNWRLKPGEYIPIAVMEAERQSMHALELPTAPKGERWWGRMQQGGEKFTVRATGEAADAPAF